MADRERVIHGRIIALYRVEIGADQEFRTARHGHPTTCLRAGDWIGLAVRAHDAGFLPGRIAARSGWRWALHLVAPRLAAPVFAALNEVAAGACERIVRPPERIDAAVSVVIGADIEPDFRHP